MTPEVLFAYLAGHFDGEGSVCMQKDSRSKYIQVSCKVSNTYLPVLEAYQTLFEGTISTINMERRRLLNPAIKSMKQQYLWCISSKILCKHFLLQLEPYLMEKQERAREALLFLNGDK